MISKALSTSEKFGGLVTLGEMAEFVQLLYPLLVVHSDDFGRLQGDPYTVKLICLPASPRSLGDFGHALRQLDAVGLIRWYESEGKSYIEIQNFERHQLGLHKRTASHFPEVPGSSGKFTVARARGTELKGTKEKGTNNPPTPLSAKGGRLTRKQLKTAETIRNRVHGGCPHTPRCDTAEACIRVIAMASRGNGHDA
jgi:hypothetical protein